MALAFKLKTLEGLDPSVQALYTEKDGEYFLDVSDLPEVPDVAGLRAKVDELLTEKKEAAQKAKEAQEAARKAAEDAARKDGDVEALDKSWQEKFTAKEGELNALLEEKDKAIYNLTVRATASKIAGELAMDLGDGQTTASILEQLIMPHLKAETRDGEPVTIVVDEAGKPTAASLKEFQDSFSKNPAITPLIAGSKATGSGAAQGHSSGRATEKTFKDLTENERLTLFRTDKDEYIRLRDADKGAN